MTRMLVLSLAVVVTGWFGFAQKPPDAEPNEPLIRSNVHEVVLDTVVRQKNMRLAKKLKASDFTVTEDGVPQTIKSFRFISGSDTQPVNEPAPPAPVSTAPSSSQPVTAKAVREPSFVSIVFDQISPGSRKYAQDATEQFLKHELRADTYVSIFALDYRMTVLQSFTDDRTLLARAVSQAAVGQYSSLTTQNAAILNQADYAVSGGPGGISISSSINPAKTAELATAGADTSIDEGAQAAAKIVADQRDVAMYQGGMRTIMALMNLVKYESALPGRKTVIYMSEGLNLPPDRDEIFRDVISAANRGNISFYGIDVRGLGTFNANALSKNLAASAAAASRSQQSRPKIVTTGNAKEFDTIMQMTVGNTQLNMAALAERTGGFAVANTNEIGAAMLRVMEDVRTHYEISYVPTSNVYDGHFRHIAVSVSNPSFSVQSREGYYALPNLNGQSMLPYELAGLHALDEKPMPQAFPFRVEALRFRPAEDGFRYEVAFDVATRNITPKVNEATHLARLHATFLALVKRADGEVVGKVSRDIDQNVPQDKLEQFRRGDIIFSSPVVLAPGRYTVEAAVIDGETKRAGTKRSVVVVTRPGPMTVSDIALVHDVEPISGPRDPGDPLEFEGGKVTPELDSAAKTTGATSLYFVVYPGADGVKPKVTVEFSKDGTTIASSEPKLSDPDELRSIPVIASATLPAGEYVAQVTVEKDGHAVRRSTAFTVAQ